MNAITIRNNIKKIASLNEDDHLSNIESNVQTYISCVEHMAGMRYDEFNNLYNELLEIVSTNEIRFITIFVYAHIKLQNKYHTIVCFEKKESYENSYEATDATLAYYEQFTTKNKYVLRFFINDIAMAPDISESVYKDFLATINYFLHKETAELTDADHVTMLTMLSIARIGALKYGNLEDVYGHFFSYIELITVKGDPQRARDSLEELLIASEHDSLYYCGMFSKFVLAVKQERHFEALFVLNISLPLTSNAQPIHKHFLYIFKLSTAQLFRNIQFHSIATNEFKQILDEMHLNDYQSQQVWNSYFSSRVSEKDNTVIQDAENYLFQNIENILQHSTHSNRPWIALLCAMSDIFNYKSQAMSHFLDIFDRTMDEHSRKSFYNLIGFGDDIKQSLRDNINCIFKSRRANDIAAQLKSISPIVKKALASGINSLDAELLLMATIAQSIPFPVQEVDHVDGLITITASEDTGEHDFLGNLCEKFFLFSKHNHVILTNYHDGYLFYITFRDTDIKIHQTACTTNSIESWISNHLPSLAFEETRKKNGFVEGYELYWEEESNKIQNSLPPVTVNTPPHDEYFILSSITTLKFPANLIRSYFGYISSACAISILLPSFFQRDPFTSDTNPRVKLYRSKEQDITLEMAIDTITTSIHNYLSSDGEELAESSPNIVFFVGHGTREGDRFKGVSLGDEGILLPFEFARICNSEIIVLFVCHSGFSSNMLFGIDSFSLAKELIDRGARHVIAPSWPLNIKLTGPWAKAFLDRITDGYSVSKSCYFANMELKNIFKIESAWAAMHHYQG